MKKNKNCEISHIVRPEVTLEVYNQKQNALFIFECVEHRRFKVTCARLWVYSDGCMAKFIFRAYAWPSARFGRTHGQVHVSDVRTAECMFLDKRSARRFVTPSARSGRTHDRVHVFGRARGLAVCDARFGWVCSSTVLGARLGRVRGSDLRGARLGRDACAHGHMHVLVRSRNTDWLRTG